MAETNSLLNCRTCNGYRGFESPSLREKSLGLGLGVSVSVSVGVNVNVFF